MTKAVKETAGWDPKSRCVYSPEISTAAPPLAAAGLVVPNSPQLFLISAPFTHSQLEAFSDLLLGLFVCRLLTQHGCSLPTTLSLAITSSEAALGLFRWSLWLATSWGEKGSSS